MSDQKQKVFIVCGSGGVGKTTVSASLGLKLATAGQKVMVLTIDPAHRLATALGLKGLTDTPTQVEIVSGTKKQKTQGELWAMMLDTKRTFDRLVDHYATSKESRDRIFHNKLYQTVSRMMAGTQEYMAMERLYEIYQEDTYDVLIVDTPPMQNAIDFLAAPGKMMNVINNSMLHVLLKPTLSLGKKGLTFLGKGSKHILKIFDRITGFAFMQDLSEMLIAFQDLLSGFESRAQEVEVLLKDPDTFFWVVCTSSEHSYYETKEFAAALKDNCYHLGRLVLNRVYPSVSLSGTKLKSIEKKLEQQCGKKNTQKLMETYKMFLPLVKQDEKWLQQMRGLVPSNTVSTIPLFLTDVHDLEGLRTMAGAL